MAQATKRNTTPPPNQALLSGLVDLPTVSTLELIRLLDLAYAISDAASGICNRSHDNEVICKVADAADGLVDQVGQELATRSPEDGYEAELLARARLRYLAQVGGFLEIVNAAAQYAAVPVLA